MTLKNLWILLFWLLLAIFAWLLLRESTPKPPPFPYFDKLQHGLVFLTLTALGFKAHPPKPAWILALMIIYASTTEILQGLLTVTRQTDLFDWLANILGIALAFLLLKMLKRKHGVRV